MNRHEDEFPYNYNSSNASYGQHEYIFISRQVTPQLKSTIINGLKSKLSRLEQVAILKYIQTTLESSTFYDFTSYLQFTTPTLRYIALERKSLAKAIAHHQEKNTQMQNQLLAVENSLTLLHQSLMDYQNSKQVTIFQSKHSSSIFFHFQNLDNLNKLVRRLINSNHQKQQDLQSIKSILLEEKCHCRQADYKLESIDQYPHKRTIERIQEILMPQKSADQQWVEQENVYLEQNNIKQIQM